MDKLKAKASSARNRLVEHTSRGTGTSSLPPTHSTPPQEDNANTTVNDAVPRPLTGTSAKDFAAPQHPPTEQSRCEPPTSLESSVDAGEPVPVPPRRGSASTASRTAQDASTPQLRAVGRPRSNSAPQRSTSSSSQPNRPMMSYRQPSVGLRRCPSPGPSRTTSANPTGTSTPLNRTASRLPVLDETCALEHQPTNATDPAPSISSEGSRQSDGGQPSRLKKASMAIQSKLGLTKTNQGEDGITRPTTPTAAQPYGREYSASMVDVLDTLDPEVQAITSLTNVQNSLFVPNLGNWVNRRPTYVLRPTRSERQSLEEINAVLEPARRTQAEQEALQRAETQEPPEGKLHRTRSEATLATVATIDSQLSESRFAVLPHGASLAGWSREDKAELNDHVRHMLHSRRSKFKRAMRGFGQYVRRRTSHDPILSGLTNMCVALGFLVTLYASLITLFGLAWVLFLIGWINVGGRQIYVVHVIDSVLVALFGVVGYGLAPFRAVDTYHMIYIAHYHHYTWSRRKKDRLPKLHDRNDLPSRNAPVSGPMNPDPEDPEKQWEFTVLTPKQQARLEHHQAKFSSSHSFYQPHETETHYAFPLRFLIAIVVLLDCHSLLQISLGATTWGIYYKDRHFAITTVILCLSIACNATAGLLITIGDHKTRKKDVIERMNRQELTERAMHKVEKKKERESESEREDNDDAGKRKKSMEIRRSLDIVKRRLVEGKSGLGSENESSGSPGGPLKKVEEGSAYP
ncbi:uncharacterized protein EI97DRAFT_436918 [Westerdykella ornata]|uniref:Integral membrane protein n=1 Tax=Westerdykella ornata TaxID=318751 RepID=A0A6A6J7P1_WESOR|nr:uncharacterized protein EI97DRAFT_436918 [Westerdykella ornata]KAF2272422.1 hypothetical protein EI97DRAFT_436918 [Westerdykella ornata]